MSATRTEPDIAVKDVMSSPVRTVKESDNVTRVAKMMAKAKIGSVIVVDKKRNPIGMITEKDIVRRVAAKGVHPNKINAAKIMSKPLRTVEFNLDIKEAARRMKQLKMKRFAVMEAGKLVGIVTATNIVEITPALIDVMEEKSKAGLIPRQRETSALAGYCDQCGTWSDRLKARDGSFLCTDCSSDLEKEG